MFLAISTFRFFVLPKSFHPELMMMVHVLTGGLWCSPKAPTGVAGATGIVQLEHVKKMLLLLLLVVNSAVQYVMVCLLWMFRSNPQTMATTCVIRVRQKSLLLVSMHVKNRILHIGYSIISSLTSFYIKL